MGVSINKFPKCRWPCRAPRRHLGNKKRCWLYLFSWCLSAGWPGLQHLCERLWRWTSWGHWITDDYHRESPPFTEHCVGRYQRLRKTLILQSIIHILNDQIPILLYVLFPIYSLQWACFIGWSANFRSRIYDILLGIMLCDILIRNNWSMDCPRCFEII